MDTTPWARLHVVQFFQIANALFERGRAVVLQHFGALVGGVFPVVVHAVHTPPELQSVDLSAVAMPCAEIESGDQSTSN